MYHLQRIYTNKWKHIQQDLIRFGFSAAIKMEIRGFPLREKRKTLCIIN